MKHRTNIELEMDDVAEIMRRYGLRTKTEAVALALSRLARRPMSLEEALAMHGKYPDAESPPDEPFPER
jgi:Arc/MetJ family transcription regulator